jgi:hypothetical protein
MELIFVNKVNFNNIQYALDTAGILNNMEIGYTTRNYWPNILSSVRVILVTIRTGSSSDDWIYCYSDYSHS